MEFQYAELHAFPDGDAPHSGNPAGVMLLHRPLDDVDLQGLARSNNLSETAYLTRLSEADLWNLRWFTPGQEVDLCGHATLASAAWLFFTGQVQGETARFDTRSGRLSVRRLDDGRFEMDFPAVPFTPSEPAPGVQAALGLGAPEAVYEVERIHGARYQMWVYPDEAQIQAMTPDWGGLGATGVNVAVTAPGTRSDIASRFLCPAAGLAEEDPVTGSAHCTLGPYWFERLGRTHVTARQIGPRSGALEVRAGAEGRVLLVGDAARYLDGVIRL